MATTKWIIDPIHSEVTFRVKHMMFTNLSGRFSSFDVNIITEDDDFSKAVIEFYVDAGSVDTRSPDRDNHLKSADFFNVEKYPKITFKVSSFTKVDNENYELAGDLTIRDVTKFVKLPAQFSGLMTDPWGTTKVGINIFGEVDRNDWGLKWNSPLDNGGFLLSDIVKFDIEIQLVRQ
ncbi:hypothetical protein FEDK69T_14070 [Flavobacterium enshiense DK69]|uniref:Lipid/polyisoprenoid-binding YceI-like domain-containing protein n=1 Tax=Flavobacterium enshiense DK69 TaxID=1107311 RepID=V6S9B2_9FLAO|nr:YceI family protein [Flavobacterium enshiense]ESU23253.1 hypothetical protein FEDK69T_14070 [Flavobacterium enshiense DK69]KGO96518.1 hypothetical protein Q767_06370 [Flavobacterium enshiense DK69]